jgi:hypothetical protein
VIFVAASTSRMCNGKLVGAECPNFQVYSAALANRGSAGAASTEMPPPIVNRLVVRMGGFLWWILFRYRKPMEIHGTAATMISPTSSAAR